MAATVSGVLCVQAEDEINLQEVVDKLPEDLVGKLNISALPSTEEAEKLAREKCRKESGSDDAYDKAFAAKDELKTCFTSLLNMEELKQEMEKAKPTGDLDLVFKKYCQLTPVLKQCVFNFTFR
ncbi:27 kDa hemolymph protein-like [Ctenocephalides felis]|uniref:27 kDa hemolymph protein-like n=1 Tax=Ctenocephalides felis TaxID=7515 RepID=UPI000E6E4393|nr:27 kDa hemolymph protein-like [Ctenocephalides felis]